MATPLDGPEPARDGSYWEGVRATGLAVPTDRPLADLTTELTRMLGAEDADLREGIAVPALVAWVERGVYDDLLVGLGDGMATGLGVGLGERGTGSVLRRSASAAVLTACLARDQHRQLVPAGKVLEWGDRLATWLLRERDVLVGGAIGRGADALGQLAGSAHLRAPELTVLLDVVADRVLARSDVRLPPEDADRLAAATLTVLRRDVLPLPVLEPWVARLAEAAGRRTDSPDEGPANAEQLLRSLHLQLALGARPPAVRTDLLLAVIDALRASNPGL